MESCISLRHINKDFGTKHILKDICLEIPYGSIYGLLGPSGCGKTTTVKIVSGILEATSGEAFVFGEKMPTLELMGRMGYMAQSDALYQVLSARENLEFLGRIYGLSEMEIKAKIDENMELVNLTQHLDKQVSAFSGGMKRRLSLAAALLHNPKLLVLDEPTVGIDPVLRADIWVELRKLAAKGITILITTHVMDEAEKCTQMSMMRDGMILASGTPAEIIVASQTSSLEEAFIYYGKAGDDHEN